MNPSSDVSTSQKYTPARYSIKRISGATSLTLYRLAHVIAHDSTLTFICRTRTHYFTRRPVDSWVQQRFCLQKGQEPSQRMKITPWKLFVMSSALPCTPSHYPCLRDTTKKYHKQKNSLCLHFYAARVRKETIP